MIAIFIHSLNILKNNYDSSTDSIITNITEVQRTLYIFPKKLDKFPPFSVIKIPLEKCRWSISAEWLITNHSTSRQAPNKITFYLSADYQSQLIWPILLLYYTTGLLRKFNVRLRLIYIGSNTVIKCTSSSNYCFMSCRRLLADLSDLYYITFLIKYRLNVYCRDSIYVFRIFSKL